MLDTLQISKFNMVLQGFRFSLKDIRLCALTNQITRIYSGYIPTMDVIPNVFFSAMTWEIHRLKLNTMSL